jgi:hypothetical protein
MCVTCILYISAGCPWWYCSAGNIAALLMYPWPLLIPHHNKHGGKEIRVDLCDNSVSVRRLLHPSLLQISPFASGDINHPGHVCRVRRRDDRQLHHRGDYTVEGGEGGGGAAGSNPSSSSSSWSQATTATTCTTSCFFSCRRRRWEPTCIILIDRYLKGRLEALQTV